MGDQPWNCDFENDDGMELTLDPEVGEFSPRPTPLTVTEIPIGKGLSLSMKSDGTTAFLKLRSDVTGKERMFEVELPINEVS